MQISTFRFVPVPTVLVNIAYHHYFCRLSKPFFAYMVISSHANRPSSASEWREWNVRGLVLMTEQLIEQQYLSRTSQQKIFQNSSGFFMIRMFHLLLHDLTIQSALAPICMMMHRHRLGVKFSRCPLRENGTFPRYMHSP